MVAIMTRRDARSLEHSTLEEMRRLGVSRVLAGETQVAVAASLQVNLHTVSKWMRKFREGGEAALASTKAPGPSRTLSDAQIAKPKRIVVGKNPRQLHFGPALWTLSLIGQLVERLFGVEHHVLVADRLSARRDGDQGRAGLPVGQERLGGRPASCGLTTAQPGERG